MFNLPFYMPKNKKAVTYKEDDSVLNKIRNKQALLVKKRLCLSSTAGT